MPRRAIFLYGTLLDPAVFARFAGRAAPRRALSASLGFHRRVMLRGTPYPTLLRGGAGAVSGLLLPRLAPSALARLAAYEGPSYRLVPVTVATPRGRRRAWAWIAPAWRADRGRDWVPLATPGALPASRAGK